MRKTIKLNSIRVRQRIGDIYVSSIDPQLLLQMSVVDRRRIENDEEIIGIQRDLREEKVRQIKKYLSSNKATFPNSIILNTEEKYIIKKEENYIEIEVNENAFTIIDGQHRVEGFRDNPIDNFNLIISILVDLKIDEQAEIFTTINSQQTKVDPSHNLNLELESKVYTPIKMMIEIAQSFNYDKESPWYNSIKLLRNSNNGIISLSAFVKPLNALTFSDNDYYIIKNELNRNTREFPIFSDIKYDTKKYIFWNFYKSQDFKSVYKILFNYFKALSIVLDKDWLNENSLLSKTTGYNATMKLFKDLYTEGLKSNNLTYAFFFDKLSKLSSMNGSINSENFGASGFKASNDLYFEMKNNLQLKNE
jgi:DGQHR domain-containing protein